MTTHPPTDSYRIRAMQEFLGVSDVKTAMIYTGVLNGGGRGGRSPADGLRRRPVNAYETPRRKLVTGWQVGYTTTHGRKSIAGICPSLPPGKQAGVGSPFSQTTKAVDPEGTALRGAFGGPLPRQWTPPVV